MTLCESLPRETQREGCIPVLETTRLTLRAPHLEDAKAVAALANDRRIAENTARIPHPYKLADAKSFIGTANTSDKESVFLITARNGASLSISVTPHAPMIVPFAAPLRAVIRNTDSLSLVLAVPMKLLASASL